LQDSGFYFGERLMLRLHVLSSAIVAALVVASCAPKPEPIVPEPIYDKFGHLEAVCVNDDEQRNPNSTLPQLPRCEDHCDPGQQPTFTVRGQWPICTPIREGSDQPDDPQRRVVN
jgi:hypothetical protein